MAKANAAKSEANSKSTGDTPQVAHAYARARRGNSGNDDKDSGRLQVVVHSDIVDRFDGLSVTHEVWATEPSARFLSEALLNPTVREEVCNFFIKRDFGVVFKDLLPGGTRTVKLSDCMFTKAEIYQKLQGSKRSPGTTGVLMELILPLFLSLGAVNGNMRYSKHTRYGFNRVTVKDVANEVSTYQVMQAVKSAHGSAIDRNVKYSVAALAEILAEAFRPIGLALLEYSDLTRIVDDMVSGVRAHIDPTLSAGSLNGNVPSDWRNSPVIAELAQNMVFIRAALSIPPGSSISPISEGWKLNQWGAVILASLKSSERYAWVGKAEVLRSYGLTHVRNGRGKIESCILYRSAKVQPVAQAVFAFEDTMLPGSYNISPTKDRIADAVQSAYGSAAFNTEDGAAMVANLLTDGIEAGWKGHHALYVVDTAETSTDVLSFAALLSSRLYVYVDKSGIVEGSRDEEQVVVIGSDVGPQQDKEAFQRTWSPKWWYTVPTIELDLDIESGSHNRTEVLTTDYVEVFLAHTSFTALEPMVAKPQILGAAAFNTRVVNFDEAILQGVEARYSFDLTINNVQMRGSFKPIGFASMRSGLHTSLVKPHYNEAVIIGLSRAYQITKDTLLSMSDPATWVTKSTPGTEFMAYMNRRIAGSVLKLAQQLAPSFRNEVHEAVIDRSLAQSQLTPDEAVVTRAKLAQRTFSAAADMIALDFFLAMQGMNVKIWTDMMQEDEMVRVWMEVGSDREQRPVA